jgi:ABC-type lipoprotein release transport system permease subunit
MWVVLLVLILIVLSVMFGGFRKGTKTGSLNHSPAVAFTFSSSPLPMLPDQ